MEEKVTADLLKRYFAGNCTSEEETWIEDWLQANPANTKLAMQWHEEFSEEDEQLFIEVLSGEKDVWRKTIESTHPENATQILSPDPKKNKRLTVNKSVWLKAAAVLAGFILLAFAVQLYWSNRLLTVQTTYGQIRTIQLPDHSVVKLNGNSKLRYKKTWQGKMREVWLDGEAFFEVKHLENQQKFVVHLSDEKEIEVLGTAFNVSDRHTGSVVVLKSGKIKLNLQAQGTSDTTPIYLQPGELVTIPAGSNQKRNVSKSRVNPQLYYAWTNGRWMLDGTSLGEMLQRLEETYGIQTVVTNQALLERRASGSIPLPETHPEALVTDIASLFELKIRKQHTHIYLESIR